MRSTIELLTNKSYVRERVLARRFRRNKVGYRKVAPYYVQLNEHLYSISSLSRNQELWCSTDDVLTEQRIRFLSEYAESEFSAQLQRSKSPLGKNEKLAQLCLQKCEGTKEDSKAISFLNQALLLAESPDTING